jgi:hypothetical protein
MHSSSEAILLNIIENSLSYPSGDNSQAFQFKILSDEEFKIYHLSKIAKHRLNFGDYA